MNKIILIGNVTKDPEIRYTQNEKVYTTFSLAVNRRNKETDYFNCIAWEKTAELIAQYVKKGSKVGVSGRLETDKVEEKYFTKVIVEEISF